MRGIRPARQARRPASTASFIAVAIATGSSAPGNTGVHQDAVDAQLHRQRGVRGGADSGVDDHRDRRELPDDPDVVRVLNPEAGADRRPERHYGGGAGVLQLAAGDRIVVRVGQDDEAFLYEDPGRFHQRRVVGEERPLVADHLQLHPFRESRLATEPRGADRIVRRVAAGRVGQQHVAVGVDVLEDRLPRLVRRPMPGQLHAPDRHRHHLGARGVVRRDHHLRGGVFAGPDDET